MSLLCQRCHEAKATVHITDTAPEKRERHLCEACAETEGVIVKQQHHTTTEILQQFIKHKTGLGSADDIACPECGLTFREFQLKGQLGCPHDYQAFKKVLTPLIERAHEGATHHVGKVPATADDTVQKHAGLLRLRRKLQEAIDQENYEQAARVRDQIQTLETS
jgi:protein arginine kinase activator